MSPFRPRDTGRLPRILLAGLVLGAFFLWLTFRGVDSGDLLRILGEVRYTEVGVAYLLAVTGCVVRAVQWRIVLNSTKQVPLLHLFRSLMIGFLYNFLMPVRVGEVVRSAYTSRQERIPFTTVLTTVALTRILDLMALLALWVYVALFSGVLKRSELPESLVSPIVTTAYVLAALCIAALATATLMSLYPSRSYRLAKRLLRRAGRRSSWIDRGAGRLLKLLANFLHGLKLLRTWRHFVAALLTSLVVWLLSAAVIHWVLLAFGVHLPYAASMLVLVVISMGIALPAVPGYVGQFHAACRYALVPFAVPAAKAAGIALFLHALHFSYTLVLGGISLVGGGLTWDHLRRLGAREEPVIRPSEDPSGEHRRYRRTQSEKMNDL